jgi:hypothetical protein
MDPAEIAIIKAKLTSNENQAYEKYIESQGKPLAFSVQLQFYELFLSGSNCEEILRLNPAFPLGAIVKARIEGGWDTRREQYMAVMLDSVRERVQQTQLEAIYFAADLLSAAHKLHGDKLKKFKQTGNVEELGTLRIDSLKAYKEAVELLLKLTGQDKDSKVKGEVLHRHTVEQPVPVENTSLTPEQAAKVLEIIEAKEKK